MGNASKLRSLLPMKVLSLCVFLAFSAAVVSGYSSGYSSGSATGYASAATSAYASGAGGASSTVTVSPTPAPTPGKYVQNFVSAAIKLAGISKAQFGSAEQTAFKTVVAAGIKFCGSNGATQCVAKDVEITAIADARRAGVQVDFKVKTTSAATAASAAAAVNTMTTGANLATFTASLKAAGGNLANVTGVVVVKAAAAGSETVTTTVSAVSRQAMWSTVSLFAVFMMWTRQ